MRFIRDIIAEKQANRLSANLAVPEEDAGPEFDLDGFEQALHEDGTAKGAPAESHADPEEPRDHRAGQGGFDGFRDSAAGPMATPPTAQTLRRSATPQAADVPPTPDAQATAEHAPTQAHTPQNPAVLRSEIPLPATEPEGRPEAPPRAAMPAPDIEAPAAPSASPPGAVSPAPVEVPRPAAGRSAARSGRVKTRLLGFGAPQDSAADPFEKQGSVAPAAQVTFPAGWLIIVQGPGRGTAFALHEGVAQIGRSADQAVPLGFGDNSISRENHAAIAYDDEQRAFFLGHGGKANLVRLNGRPVLSTETLQSGDTIRIGETTMRFVALCGSEFSWTDTQTDGGPHVSDQ